MRIVKYAGGGLLAIIVAVAAIFYFMTSGPVAVTAPQIQSIINPKLPFNTKFGVSVSKADIDLSQPGNQVGVHFVMTYDRGGAAYTVAGTAIGTVRYDS